MDQSQPQTEFHPNDPHFHIRSQIDEEILSLKRQIQILQVKKNSLLPISRLPKEVLVEIWLDASVYHCGGRVASERILKTGWVCHAWRQMSLGHPLLWTEIDEGLSEKWTNEFLKRSRSAEIYLEVYLKRKQSDLIHSVPSEFHRVRDLKIINARHQESVLTIPAPILLSLDLRGCRIPRQLFSGLSPILHIIKLAHCRKFNFDKLIFLSQLTELHLDHPKPKPVFPQFLTRLGSFPHLQTLTLEDALDEEDEEDETYVAAESPLPHIDLPALHSITIQDCSVFVVSPLLSHITVKQGAIARIWESDESALIRHALRFYEHFEPISLHVSHHFYFTMVPSAPERPTATVMLTTTSFSPTELPFILLKLNIERLFPSLRSVTLQYRCDWTAPPISFWANLLAPQPNLQVMKLGGVYAISFVEYMSSLHPYAAIDFESFNDDSTGHLLPFRSLRSLTIQAVPENKWPDILISYQFFQVLKKRKEGGIGLEELSLKLHFRVPMFDDVLLTTYAAVVHVAPRKS
ncbi:hypothetical protein BDN72DRAFT_944491 [Pluteus cervinus]|uniref:Uncharacterized protein n=1 Tax=Pluteus cervinus TaxID=181527 RepID=A0ACD3A1X0_9AGAR|nr:hypothetical protein BDN72DRAFT_944491 [Pluteus cervinus]